MSKKIGVLVFPAGEINSVELHDALATCVNIELYGASSIDKHGEYVFKNYISGLPMISEENFFDEFNKIIEENNIDVVFPTHDTVADFFAENKDRIKANIIVADRWTAKVCRDKKKTYEVFEKEIERKLQDIIIITRSIPTDKEFYQKNINRVQPFFTSEAGEQLKESLRANQVTEKLNNRESVTVDIDSVIKLERNKRKYQVIWTEKYMKMTGDIAIKKYVAVILVDVKSNEMKKNNPLGVMIKDINISESNISKTE